VEIRSRPPTTDTYSMAQTQEEFYFALPYDRMDLCLWAFNHDVPAADAAPVLDLTPAQVERVYRDIDAKRRTTRYLPFHSCTTTWSTPPAACPTRWRWWSRARASPTARSTRGPTASRTRSSSAASSAAIG
jgi:hypothetical protein